MSEAIEIAKTVAKEYADQTNVQINSYYKQTSDAIRDMSKSVSTMAVSVQESSHQLARYEERQTVANERMERIERGLRDQGVLHREYSKEADIKVLTLRDEIRDNSFIRKIAVWLSCAIIASMIGGGMVFSSLTGKITDQVKYQKSK